MITKDVPTTNRDLMRWVGEVTRLVEPQKVHWCDGSQEEHQRFVQEMVDAGELLALNSETYPGCYLYRSDPQDVARSEHRTFICTSSEEDAGSNNNWLAPEQAHSRMDALFRRCMKGRTLYVVPYCMGHPSSRYAQFGVEITDSLYVVVNMKIMTRMGREVLSRIDGLGEDFVRGLHSTGDLSPENRWIMHFPQEMMIKSYGSGYGGNALLGKKCHALRLASYQGRREGWLAEHMLIVGIEDPQGRRDYIAAAFPSACGKTNLAMMIPPRLYKGWKIWTVGDDIAWLRPGEDGRLWAMNPEAGFFGVAPGTSAQTNPHAYGMLQQNTLFTNVGLTAAGEPWWEGKDDKVPTVDWLGTSISRGSEQVAAHPNARFTVSCEQCPSYQPPAPEVGGVPLSAILFGSRRASLVPLVFEAQDWLHGVLAGASMCSETTAAASGETGVLRHDPMAMKPFCGYNFGDYWQHWMSVGAGLKQPPRLFHVNWFRQDSSKRYLWPGFGENIRVLQWILQRCRGEVEGITTPLGILPHSEDLNTAELDLAPHHLRELLYVDGKAYAEQMGKVRTFFEGFGSRTPQALLEACSVMQKELQQYRAPT